MRRGSGRRRGVISICRGAARRSTPQRPPVITHQQHLRLFALFAELLGGINREQHRFPLGRVWAVLFAIEVNEPEVLLTVACTRTARDDRQRLRFVTRLGSSSPMIAYRW
jgi:hypothetical protein